MKNIVYKIAPFFPLKEQRVEILKFNLKRYETLLKNINEDKKPQIKELIKKTKVLIDLELLSIFHKIS